MILATLLRTKTFQSVTGRANHERTMMESEYKCTNSPDTIITLRIRLISATSSTAAWSFNCGIVNALIGATLVFEQQSSHLRLIKKYTAAQYVCSEASANPVRRIYSSMPT